MLYFLTRMQKGFDRIGHQGSKIRDKHRGLDYCCIYFSLYLNAPDYAINNLENPPIAISSDQLA